MTLYLDLNAFAEMNTGTPADSELLRRVDRRVATYYLAVPLAGEDNRVTVATAYPDNADALRMLERLLKAAVVPVSSSEDDLQAAIARGRQQPDGLCACLQRHAHLSFQKADTSDLPQPGRLFSGQAVAGHQ